MNTGLPLAQHQNGQTATEILTEAFPNTAWQCIAVAGVRNSHRIWSRQFDGEQIYTVLPASIAPSANDGGYKTIATALKTRGLVAASLG